MEQNPPAKPGASGPLIRIEPITGQHDLSCFSCSEQELNDFLTTDALTDHTSLYSITRLVYYNGTLAGFSPSSQTTSVSPQSRLKTMWTTTIRNSRQ